MIRYDIFALPITCYSIANVGKHVTPKKEIYKNRLNTKDIPEQSKWNNTWLSYQMTETMNWIIQQFFLLLLNIDVLQAKLLDLVASLYQILDLLSRIWLN